MPSGPRYDALIPTEDGSGDGRDGLNGSSSSGSSRDGSGGSRVSTPSPSASNLRETFSIYGSDGGDDSSSGGGGGEPQGQSHVSGWRGALGAVMTSAGYGGWGLAPSETYMLLLLCGIVVLLFADQSLMAPNMSAMARDFGMNEHEKDSKLGGQIAVAFFCFGAPASVLVGYLSDKMSRKDLFAGVVLVGEGACFLTAFVTSYSQLFWARAVTGVAVGGALPLTFSLLGDLVPSAHRSTASGLVGMTLGVGQGVGNLVAGIFGSTPHFGWRLPFVIIALPALVLGLVLQTTTTEPVRGRSEAALQGHLAKGGEYRETVTLPHLKTLFMTPSVLLTFAQGLPGCVPWGTINTFLSDFLQEQRGLSVQGATMIVFFVGLGSSVGMAGGAPLGQRLYDKQKALQPLLMCLSTLLGIMPGLVLLHAPPDRKLLLGLSAFLLGLLAAVTGPNVRALLLNTTSPATRGSAFGVYNLFDDLGRGLGPAYVSVLIRQVGRQKAFALSFYFWALCALFLGVMTLTYARDEARIQALLKEYAGRQYDAVEQQQHQQQLVIQQQGGVVHQQQQQQLVIQQQQQNRMGQGQQHGGGLPRTTSELELSAIP